MRVFTVEIILLSGTLISYPFGIFVGSIPSGSNINLPPLSKTNILLLSASLSVIIFSILRIDSLALYPVSPGAVFSLSSSCRVVPVIITLLSSNP